MLYMVYARDPRRTRVFSNVTSVLVDTKSGKYRATRRPLLALHMAAKYKKSYPGDRVKIMRLTFK